MNDRRGWPGAARLWLGLVRAAHAGFPWAARAGQGASARVKAALRRAVIGQFPPETRGLARLLMVLLWPVESLRDALTHALLVRPGALAGRTRLGIAAAAWGAALADNLPPVDFIACRLFAPGRPAPARWLHSADAHLLFAALADDAARGAIRDKLAFADLARAFDVPSLPILAAYGSDGPIRPFADGAPPPRDLLVKPRYGSGSRGLAFWEWRDDRHRPADGLEGVRAGETLSDWLERSARETDLVVQDWARPPAALGGLAPLEAPVASVLTVEWPDRRRAIVHVQLVAVVAGEAGPVALFLAAGADGRVTGLAPGVAAPVWRTQADPPEVTPFDIPSWDRARAGIDRVHAALPGPAPVLKWDVLLTADGPRLLEANAGPGVHSIQAASLRPLTETALGEVLEAWVP